MQLVFLFLQKFEQIMASASTPSPHSTPSPCSTPPPRFKRRPKCQSYEGDCGCRTPGTGIFRNNARRPPYDISALPKDCCTCQGCTPHNDCCHVCYIRFEIAIIELFNALLLRSSPPAFTLKAIENFDPTRNIKIANCMPRIATTCERFVKLFKKLYLIKIYYEYIKNARSRPEAIKLSEEFLNKISKRCKKRFLQK